MCLIQTHGLSLSIAYPDRADMVCHWEDSDCVTQEVFYNVCICFYFCVWSINIFAIDDIPSFSCLPGRYHMYLRCFCCPDSMIIYTHHIPPCPPAQSLYHRSWISCYGSWSNIIPREVVPKCLMYELCTA